MTRKRDLQLLELDEDATMEDIQFHYQRLLQVYGNQSLASYGLFKVQERQKFIQALQGAFQRLVEESVQSIESQPVLYTSSPFGSSSSFHELHDSKPTPEDPHPIIGKEEILNHLANDFSDPLRDSVPIRNLASSDYWLAPQDNVGLEGKEINNIRLSRGISLETMSKHLGIPKETLKQLEMGDVRGNLSEEELILCLSKISNYLRIDEEQCIQDYLYFHWQEPQA